MFRNLILPGLTVGALLILVTDPKYGHETTHKKITAAVTIAVAGLAIRVLITTKRWFTAHARARAVSASQAPPRARYFAGR